MLASMTLVLGSLPDRAFAAPGFTTSELTSGLRSALDQAAQAAVDRLGAPDGFLKDPAVRIFLPEDVQSAARLAKRLGLGSRLEAIETGMNRAAEAALPRIRATLKDAAARITIRDALKILTGGDTSLTDYFRAQTESRIGEALTPIIGEELARVDAVRSWNDLLARLGPQKNDLRLEAYVVRKALSGLYLAMGEEEKSIRANPGRAASGIARKIFGAFN